MTLQRKLLVVTLAALLLPVLGWLYLRQMDSMLRLARQQALVAQAQIVARSVADRVQLPWGRAWHVQHSVLPLVVDGYARDWRRLARWAEPVAGGAELLLGEHAGALHLLLTVTAPAASPRGAGAGGNANHYVDLWLGIDGQRCRYRLGPATGGMLAVHPRSPGARSCPDPLRAQWQAGDNGYRVELRLPTRSPIGALGVRVAAGGSDTVPAVDWRPLQRFSPALSRRLAALLPEDQRVRVLDQDGWVIAAAGEAGTAANDSTLDWLVTSAYRALVAHSVTTSDSLDTDTPRLSAVAAWQALSGVAASSWRRSPRHGGVTLMAAVPLPGPGPPRGAVLLQQSLTTMPLRTHPGLLWLLLGGLGLLLVAGLMLAGFALRLGWRMRRVRQALGADDAVGVDPDDKLGDLLCRYRELRDTPPDHAGVLQTLSTCISEELGRPLAAVATALDDLDQRHLPEAQREPLRRARQGSRQLAELMHAMRAAGDIEQAIEQARNEDFDLRQLVAGCAEAYRMLASPRTFDLQLPDAVVPMYGSPRLIVKALDKLFDNALSFTPEDGWVRVSLETSDHGAVIALSNLGPPLPEDDDLRLTDAFVNRRDPQARGDSPHLGLGLYVAHRVALHHRGGVVAENTVDGRGVVVRLQLESAPAGLSDEAATADQ